MYYSASHRNRKKIILGLSIILPSTIHVKSTSSHVSSIQFLPVKETFRRKDGLCVLQKKKYAKRVYPRCCSVGARGETAVFLVKEPLLIKVGGYLRWSHLLNAWFWGSCEHEPKDFTRCEIRFWNHKDGGKSCSRIVMIFWLPMHH